MQPTYLPWLGYFELINQVDYFVLYDDVQFAKQSWQSRNRIPTANGITFLTIPIVNAPLDTPIMDIQIDNSKPWRKKQLKSLYYNYIKTPYFQEVYPFVEALFNIPFESLSEMHTHFIREIAAKIGITTPIMKSSDLGVDSYDRVDRLIAICEKLETNTYLSTRGASVYLLEESGNARFSEKGIDLRYHNYQHPVYPSMVSPFTPYMCVLDLLFMVGFSDALDFIKAGTRDPLQLGESQQATAV